MNFIARTSDAHSLDVDTYVGAHNFFETKHFAVSEKSVSDSPPFNNENFEAFGERARRSLSKLQGRKRHGLAQKKAK
jgi:hypothetical protein